MLNGVNFFAKHRFLTFDGQHKHFRMAVYAEGSYIQVAHDEAEPNLMEDNKGYGGGLIATYPFRRFAASFTGGPDVPTKIQYGRALKYNLSFGYLLFLHRYENYKQGNWNLYTEFIGRSYEAAVITQYGSKTVPIQTPLLQAGNYVNVCPGIQHIFNSNLRIDLTAQLPLIGRSYTHYYPVFMLAVQRYFYPPKK